MKKQSVIALDYNEFDKLVQTHLGVKDFECVPFFEWDNDSDYLHNDVVPNDMDDLKQVNEWIQNPRQWGTGPYQILNWLCHHGHIEPGNYLIQVSW